MAASVLYDEPGPVTRRRHRIYSVVFVVVLLAALAGIILKLESTGQFEVIPDLMQSNIWVALSDGLVNTLKAAGIAIVLSVIVGFLLAVGRLSDHAVLRVPCRLIIEFFRAVPLLLLIIFIFGLTAGYDLDTQTHGLIALVGGLLLYNGSVLAEVFRAGVNAVPKGQSEAAYAIGMRKSQVMNLILTPQAVRFMLPAIISQCVVVLKDTSLGFLAAYTELLRETRGIALFLDNNLMPYLLTAVIYILLNSLVSGIATWLEGRSRRSTGGATGVQAAEEAVAVG